MIFISPWLILMANIEHFIYIFLRICHLKIKFQGWDTYMWNIKKESTSINSLKSKIRKGGKDFIIIMKPYEYSTCLIVKKFV